MIHVFSNVDFKLLGPAERKAAEYIAQHPNDTERFTITELASASHVSPATISKLCRTLEFPNFKTFRLEIAKANARSHEVLAETSADLLVSRVHHSFAASIRVLARAEANLDLNLFREAVDAISEANRVFFYGVGASGAVAIDAHYRLLRLGLDAVAYTDAHVQVWSTTTLGPSDVVVAISHSGRTRETVDVLSLAKANGARTIALTSHPHSPLGRHSDICLVSMYEPTPSSEGSVLARIAQLGIIDALAEEVALRRRTDALDR